MHSNEWVHWIPYPVTFPIDFVYCTMDHRRNILYIYGKEKTISSVHLDEQQCDSQLIDSLPSENLSCLLAVNEELYLFYSTTCCIWNTVDTAKSIVKRDIGGPDIKQAVYVPSEHCIIIISYHCKEKDIEVSVWSLDKDTVERKGLFEAPGLMEADPIDIDMDFSTLTANERFIIMTVPASSGYCIWVLNRSANKLKECTFKFAKSYHVAVSRSGTSTREDVLICGYCRIESVKAIPQEISKFIGTWYGCLEMIHFIEFSGSSELKPHFGLSTDDIILSLK